MGLSLFDFFFRKGVLKQKGKKKDEFGLMFGKDEMNLVEFPFGPIASTKTKTFKVQHEVYDKRLKRNTKKTLLVTGADAFGLPRPIDDQVLVGMKALTADSGFKSKTIRFSRYRLCKTIGWPTDGRAYQRLEASFDRIAGTTLKFKDAWWDKGESVWKSKTFHLIESHELCSRDQIDISRQNSNDRIQQLCSFTWSDVMWKSFTDGNIRTIDMEMFRRISRGRGREVAIRLYRWLGKRLYKKNVFSYDVRKLSEGVLGLNAKHLSEMKRVLDRSVKVLTSSEFIYAAKYSNGGKTISFQKKPLHRKKALTAIKSVPAGDSENINRDSPYLKWLSKHDEATLLKAEEAALQNKYRSRFERSVVLQDRKNGLLFADSSLVRQQFIREYFRTNSEQQTSA